MDIPKDKNSRLTLSSTTSAAAGDVLYVARKASLFQNIIILDGDARG